MRPGILPGVDRAAFAAALAARLRAAGVPVGVTAIADLVAALDAAFPRGRGELYWLARLTMVSSHDELAAFDAVFASVFDDAVLPLDPNARRQGDAALPLSAGRPAATRTPSGRAEEAASRLPWVTLRDIRADADAPDEARGLPELRPSAAPSTAETPFGELTSEEMARLAAWVERVTHWPTRPHRRRSADPRGRRVALRRTLARARRTGLEPVTLARESATPRSRRLVVVCDVSQSMQPVATAHLHLMRALVRHRDAEVFACSTRLTRLTRVLREGTPERAVAAASAEVGDRFGGTRLASCLGELVESRHGGLLRGAVVVIASDGWDSDPPEQMSAVMARVRRRAHTVAWLNPRAGARGFEPTVGSMAAALPHCNLLLPAGTFADLGVAVRRLSSTR